MRYYIADLHFFHENMNKKMDCRGFGSIENMHTFIIKSWNKKVRKNDEVIILGDVSWGKALETDEILEKLNGKLYLVQGNHDRFLACKEFNRKRFEWIKPYAEVQDNGRKVVLSHYPIMCYNGQYRLDKDGKPKSYMLYGHVHDTLDQRLMEAFQEITRHTRKKSMNGECDTIPCNMINCFCRYSDYTPLTLDEWIECDANRKYFLYDKEMRERIEQAILEAEQELAEGGELFDAKEVLASLREKYNI